MATSLLRRRVLFLAGLILATVLAVACASGAKAPEGGSTPAPAAAPAQAPSAPSPATPTAAPSPAVPAPIAAPATAPAPPPGATLAPTPAEKAEAGITFSNLFATREVPGGPRINPAAVEKEKGLQELLRYHVNRLPLWSKAKYGGEMTHVGSVTGGLVDPTTNPLKIGTRRNSHYGRLLYFDQGLCSWVGRDANFSVCKGQYAVNDAVLIVPGIFQRWEQPDPVTFIFSVRKGCYGPPSPP